MTTQIKKFGKVLYCEVAGLRWQAPLCYMLLVSNLDGAIWPASAQQEPKNCGVVPSCRTVPSYNAGKLSLFQLKHNTT